MSSFDEGDRVALRAGRLALGLRSGDVGVVWELYDTDSLHTEVTFVGQDGKPFDPTVEDDEIVALGAEISSLPLDASLPTAEFPVWSPFDAHEAAATLHEFLENETASRR